MTYQKIARCVVNTDLWAQSHEFSRRRKVISVTSEYIKYELGITEPPDLSNDYVKRIESELRLRQKLYSTDIVKAVQINWRSESLDLYIINDEYDPVPDGVEAPKEIIY